MQNDDIQKLRTKLRRLFKTTRDRKFPPRLIVAADGGKGAMWIDPDLQLPELPPGLWTVTVQEFDDKGSPLGDPLLQQKVEIPEETEDEGPEEQAAQAAGDPYASAFVAISKMASENSRQVALLMDRMERIYSESQARTERFYSEFGAIQSRNNELIFSTLRETTQTYKELLREGLIGEGAGGSDTGAVVESIAGTVREALPIIGEMIAARNGGKPHVVAPE